MLIEAYRELATLDLMIDNYEKTRQDTRTVQVRMEKVKADFPGMMKCALSFLQKSFHFDMEWAMQTLEPLNVKKYGQQAAASANFATNHVNTWSKSLTGRLLKRLDALPFVAQKAEQLRRPAVNDC